jgi:hypothetical protein
MRMKPDIIGGGRGLPIATSIYLKSLIDVPGVEPGPHGK